VWRDEKPKWSQQDELLATVSEVVDAWGRRIMFAVSQGPVKKPRFPESIVDLHHPDRPSAPRTAVQRAAPRRPRDEHGRAAAEIDLAAANRFFNRMRR
jgi:hypothetical protein